MAEAQVLAVQEELDVKSGECARIEAQLNQKRIKSPIDGVVTQIFKDEGEFISVSDPIVVRVVQLDALRVEFPIPAPVAGDFQAGQTVMLRVGVAQTTSPGLVEFVSPTTEPQSNTVRVKIRIDNQQGQFQSGDSCWLTIASIGDQHAASPPGYFTKAKSGVLPE